MFSLFFSHLGIGLLGCLLFVPYKRLGRGFFRFNVLLALGFLVIAAAFRAGTGTGAGPELFACILLAAGHLVSLQFRRNRLSPVLLAGAVAFGVASMLREAAGLAGAAPASAALLAAHFVTSSALLGAVLLDMILGHWYLVIPGLSFGHLQRMTLLLAVALGLRIAVIAWSVVVSWGVWQDVLQDSMRFLMQDGFLLVLRVVFGILGPAVLLVLVRGCLRIRSNTSATGILYVATVIVWIGEITSHYLLTHGTLPL
jgi:hypothetical protein